MTFSYFRWIFFLFLEEQKEPMLIWSENENFNLLVSNSLGTLFKNTKNDFCLPQFDHQSKVNPKKTWQGN